ncbi:MAG: hypothetical protein KF736_09285 [Acidobacteria bacterium]|nr:hypothetical protein [Acidobacteriota bacterium]MCW5950245.1 hypothetical protein [Pyrinomonadaceae bacterium]
MSTRFLPFIFIFAFFFLVLDAKAQSYGYSYIELDQANPTSQMILYAETGTVLDYSVWYYYDPGIQAFLYENSILAASTQRVMNYNGSYISAWTERHANYATTYKIHGDHFLGAYFYYIVGGQPVFIDYYGFNFFQGNFPSPYNFGSGPTAYYYYQIYKAATTFVTISTQRPLQLNSIDVPGALPGQNIVTMLRGTGLFGNGQNLQISGNGITASIRPGQLPNTIEVLEIELQIAQSAQVGPREIRLSVNGQTSNPVTFRVGDNSPLISNISPDVGDAGDQIAVTISGSNFGFNPDVEIDGLGVARAINSSTSTEINATFAVSASADPGTRAVKVRSRGVAGNGFEQVPGNSPLSNPVPFNVNAANPSVEIPDIGSVMKGSVVTITVRTRNAPANHITRLRFKNQISVRQNGEWRTGEAKFAISPTQDVDEVSYSGDQPQQIQIRGWERSSERNNIKLEARFGNESNVRRDRSFTVSSVEFVEENECTGYDRVEFERLNNYFDRFFYVPKDGGNRLRIKVVPSGASGSFVLEPSEPNITLSQTTVNSTNAQLITVNANASSTRHPGISVKAANQDLLTREAEQLRVEVLPRVEKNIVLYAVTEENDDVQATPQGQGLPNRRAYIFTPGPNGVIDTVAYGDDAIAPVPIGQRPPGYPARTRSVMTGENGILETEIQGDDVIFTSELKAEMREYAPVTELFTGFQGAICVTRGANDYLDSIKRGDDQEIADPNDPTKNIISAGPNGRCDTRANNTNIPAPTLPNAAELQNYLNNTTWGRQANIYFTVTHGTPFTVNFDLDRDRKLRRADSSIPSSYDEINAIKNGLNPGSGTTNLYYVGMNFNQDDILGYTFLQTRHIWIGLRSFENNGSLITAAHEIGHAMGSLHTYEPDPASPNDPERPFYERDLMFGGYLEGTVNQCRVREPQWRTTTFSRTGQFGGLK